MHRASGCDAREIHSLSSFYYGERFSCLEEDENAMLPAGNTWITRRRESKSGACSRHGDTVYVAIQ